MLGGGPDQTILTNMRNMEENERLDDGESKDLGKRKGDAPGLRACKALTSVYSSASRFKLRPDALDDTPRGCIFI